MTVRTPDTPRTAPSPLRLGIWRRRVNPLILDRIMNTAETREMRERVCAGVHGDVLEIGFGSGLNLPHLPEGVRRVLAVDPLQRSWELGQERIAQSAADVRYAGTDARALPLDAQSVDSVLCTWSLCSIDDPQAAVTEMARVLRPGGTVHFVEHGRAEDDSVRRWQHRCDPVWSRLAGGCRLDRDIPSILESGGLEVTELDTYFTKSEPKVLGWTFEGRATLR